MHLHRFIQVSLSDLWVWRVGDVFAWSKLTFSIESNIVANRLSCSHCFEIIFDVLDEAEPIASGQSQHSLLKILFKFFCPSLMWSKSTFSIEILYELFVFELCEMWCTLYWHDWQSFPCQMTQIQQCTQCFFRKSTCSVAFRFKLFAAHVLSAL